MTVVTGFLEAVSILAFIRVQSDSEQRAGFLQGIRGSTFVIIAEGYDLSGFFVPCDVTGFGVRSPRFNKWRRILVDTFNFFTYFLRYGPWDLLGPWDHIQFAGVHYNFYK